MNGIFLKNIFKSIVCSNINSSTTSLKFKNFKQTTLFSLPFGKKTEEKKNLSAMELRKQQKEKTEKIEKTQSGQKKITLMFPEKKFQVISDLKSKNSIKNEDIKSENIETNEVQSKSQQFSNLENTSNFNKTYFNKTYSNKTYLKPKKFKQITLFALPLWNKTMKQQREKTKNIGKRKFMSSNFKFSQKRRVIFFNNENISANQNDDDIENSNYSNIENCHKEISDDIEES